MHQLHCPIQRERILQQLLQFAQPQLLQFALL